MSTWEFIQALASAATFPLIVALLALIAYRQRNMITPEMRAKLSDMSFHYQWGMFSSGLNGAAMAVKGTLAVSTGAAFSPQQVQAPNPTIIVYLFGVAFALNALDWFTKNPLPTSFSMPPFTSKKETTRTETVTETKRESLPQPTDNTNPGLPVNTQ